MSMMYFTCHILCKDVTVIVTTMNKFNQHCSILYVLSHKVISGTYMFCPITAVLIFCQKYCPDVINMYMNWQLYFYL